jgi:hypothetical protein
MISAKNIFKTILISFLLTFGLIIPLKATGIQIAGMETPAAGQLASLSADINYFAGIASPEPSMETNWQGSNAVGNLQTASQNGGPTVQNNPSTEGFSPVRWFVETYEQARLRVKILIVILTYLLISLIALFLIIIINRTIKTRQRRQAEKMKHTYQEELTTFLFGEDDQPFEFTGINYNVNRDIFINELLSLHNNLSGEAATRLRDLYFNLGLYKDSLSKVNNSRWDIKAKGFREVAQMDVKDGVKQISKHINSKNPVLRSEAQVSLVKLTDDDPLYFLDNLEFELSMWEQVSIANTLDYHQINIDSFERWLTSNNDSVVIFATRMTGLNKHTHAAPSVAALLEHPNPVVRYYAIETLGLLELPDYLNDLKQTYEREHPVEPKKGDAFYHLNVGRNRRAVIEAIEPIATVGDIDFLVNVLQKEKDFDTLFAAAKVLAGIRPEGPQRLENIYQSADHQLRKIIENVKQNLE